jgi:hypothetical protein
MSELFFEPSCRSSYDICAHPLDDLYVYLEDELEPSVGREEFQRAAHSMKLDRLKELVDASRATCKAAKKLAKKAWARVKSQLDDGRKARIERETILGTYGRLPQPEDTEDEPDH